MQNSILKIGFLIFIICFFNSCLKKENNVINLPNNSQNFTQEYFDLGDLDILGSDEFDYDTIDRTKWNISDYKWWTPEPTGGGPSFFRFEFNNSKINTKRNTLELVTDYDDTIYTAAMIYSKKAYLEGFFEIRCKLSVGHGSHPAFWLLGGFSNQGNYNEVDIMESINNLPDGNQKFVTNFHIDNADNNINYMEHPDFRVDINKFTEVFHTFSLMLTENEIIWYWNNEEIRREPNSLLGTPMQIMLTGAWTGCCPPDELHPPTLPGIFEIDYIRTFYLK